MAHFLNQTPRFDWFAVRFGSERKYHKDTCFKEIGPRLQILITALHSIMNIDGRTYVSILGINKHEVSITITKSRAVRFSIRSLQIDDSSFVDLLIDHTFNCVNLINRSWRTWELDQTTPT